MTAPGAQMCSVCDVRTVNRCSACKEAFFCSKECQKLVWATHKWWCGKDTGLFLLPPLDETELANFKPLKDRQMRRGGTLLQQLDDYPTWEALVNALADPQAAGLSPLRQADLILSARAHLRHCRPSEQYGPEGPWQESIAECDLAVSVAMSHSFINGRPPTSAFRDLNPFLRQIVLVNTILRNAVKLENQGKDTAEVERKGKIAERRARNCIEKCKVGEITKNFLRQLQELGESDEDEDEDEWPRRAV
ncbi:hypothetical protein JCM6882_009431 [Rhodosporidiobolus microsporus]